MPLIHSIQLVESPLVFIPDERRLRHPLDVKLSKNININRNSLKSCKMVGPGGFEPPTPALSTRCSNQLSYEPVQNAIVSDWWSRSGSNRRPPECKSGALPAELRPRISSLVPIVSSVEQDGSEEHCDCCVPQKLFCVIY